MLVTGPPARGQGWGSGKGAHPLILSLDLWVSRSPVWSTPLSPSPSEEGALVEAGAPGHLGAGTHSPIPLPHRLILPAARPPPDPVPELPLPLTRPGLLLLGKGPPRWSLQHPLQAFPFGWQPWPHLHLRGWSPIRLIRTPDQGPPAQTSSEAGTLLIVGQSERSPGLLLLAGRDYVFK